MRQRTTIRAAIAVAAATAGTIGPLAASASAADITPIPIPGSLVSITPIPIPYVGYTLVFQSSVPRLNVGPAPGGGIGPVSGG